MMSLHQEEDTTAGPSVTAEPSFLASWGSKEGATCPTSTWSLAMMYSIDTDSSNLVLWCIHVSSENKLHQQNVLLHKDPLGPETTFETDIQYLSP